MAIHKIIISIHYLLGQHGIKVDLFKGFSSPVYSVFNLGGGH